MTPNVTLTDLVEESIGREMSYDQLKRFILQEEALRLNYLLPRAAMTARGRGQGSGQRRGGRDQDNVSKRETRCYSCGKNGSISRDCPTPGKTICYNCNQVGNHISSNFPEPWSNKQRSFDQEGWSTAKCQRTNDQPDFSRSKNS